MDSAELEHWIRAFAAADNEPVLNDADIQLIIRGARRQDVEGELVDSASWAETYDKEWAISRAWELKAGKAAGLYTYMQGGNQLMRSDMIRHCQQQSDRWRKGCYASVAIEDAPVTYAMIYGGLI
jgi:hypothetical protein